MSSAHLRELYEQVRHRDFFFLFFPPFWSTNISGFLIPTVPCPHFENTGQWILMTVTLRSPLFLLMVRERTAICCQFWCARSSINALVHYPSSMILMRLSVIRCFIASVLQTRAGTGGPDFISVLLSARFMWGQLGLCQPLYSKLSWILNIFSLGLWTVKLFKVMCRTWSSRTRLFFFFICLTLRPRSSESS